MGWIILFALIIVILMQIWDYLWIGLVIVGIFLVARIIVKVIENFDGNTEKYTQKWFVTKKFYDRRKPTKKEQRRINKIRRKTEKENKKLANVARLGNLGHSLNLINQELKFLDVVHKEVIECKTKDEYKNFTAKSYFSTYYPEISKLTDKLHNNVAQNSRIYEEYKKKFFACNDFTPEEEIKRIPKRGMSVNKFKELEKKLFCEKIKTPPNGKIVIEITIKYQQQNKIILIDEVEIKRLLQEIKDERDYNFVCLNSFCIKNLCELNEKYKFYDIKIQNFDVKCNSYNEYQKFNIRQYARKCLMMKTDELETSYNQAIKNEKLYNEYKRQYLSLSQYLLTEKEISKLKNVPLSITKFQSLEKTIYSQMVLKEPVVSFSICYKVEYTSPAGRNYYKKEEQLTRKTIGDILGEIAREEKERQETEWQKKLAKQQRAQEKAEIRNLLKNKGMLEQKEAELAQREQEFQRATNGHIYAVSDSPTIVEVEQAKIKITEEPMSAWEKMKRLKKAYENGEITYEEYNEKRKHLL